jgi:hypothetical protein
LRAFSIGGLNHAARLQAECGHAELQLGAARCFGEMPRITGAGHHSAELIPAEAEMAAMPWDTARRLLAIKHRDLADIVPRELRRRGKPSWARPQDDDIALDHGSILPATIAATFALQ